MSLCEIYWTSIPVSARVDSSSGSHWMKPLQPLTSLSRLHSEVRVFLLFLQRRRCLFSINVCLKYNLLFTEFIECSCCELLWRRPIDGPVCYHYRVTSHYWLVAWSSGRALVFGRCAFAVLRSTCSWWVTTYVSKPSATGQPTRPTQPFILSGSINE